MYNLLTQGKENMLGESAVRILTGDVARPSSDWRLAGTLGVVVVSDHSGNGDGACGFKVSSCTTCDWLMQRRPIRNPWD